MVILFTRVPQSQSLGTTPSSLPVCLDPNLVNPRPTSPPRFAQPQGFEPANPDRYAFRILTSPSLQPQRPASPPPTHPQQQQQQQGLPATAGTVSEAASTTAAAGAAAASPAGPRFRPRPRPVVSIDDLLTEEERRALAALEQRGQGQAGQG